MNVTHLTTAAQSDHTHSQYLTTAMASNNGSNFVQAVANFAGTNATGTIASNGISVSVASPVVQTAFVFSNSNGVSWGTNGSTVTATVATNYQAPGNYLTTAMASNRGSDFVQATAAFAGTNASGTIASNGISISVAAPGAGGGAALKGSGTYTQNTGTIEFANSNGITFGLSNNGTMTASHNGLTTAMASNRGTDFMGTNTALTANGVSMTANSSGLSLNFPAFLTTAMQSASSSVFAKTGFASTTTNGSVVAGTLNTNGMTLAVPPFLTTAQAPGAYLTTAALSDHSHGNPTLALTNLSGTTASNSAGLTLSLSAAAPGGGGGYSINQFENIPYVTMTNLSNMTATRFTQCPHFYPFELGGSLTHNFLAFEASRATSGSNAFTMQAALYTMANSTQLSRLASLQNVFSNTATASISGIRRFHLTGWETAGTNLTPGQYVLMIMNSGTATASMNYSYRGGLTAVPPVGVILGGTDQVQTATTYLSNAAGWRNFWGNYTTTTASPPATVAKSHIQNWTSGNNLYFYMGRT